MDTRLAESALLGALLAQPELLRDCDITPEMFQSGVLRRVFELLQRADESGFGGGLVGVKASAEAEGETLALSVLHTLDGAGRPDKLMYYVNILKYAHKKRELISGVSAVVGRLASGRASVLSATSELMTLATEMNPSIPRPVDIGVEVDTLIADAFAGRLQPLDVGLEGARNGGFLPQRISFNTVLGLPGTGKTVMCMEMARNASKTYGTRSLYVTLEMTKQELVLRMVAAELGVEIRELMCSMNEDLARRIKRISSCLQDHVSLMSMNAPSADTVCAACRRYHRVFAPHVIVIDSLTYIDRGSGPMSEAFESAILKFCSLCKELQTCIFLVHHPGRPSNGEKRSGLQSAFGSSAMEKAVSMQWSVERLSGSYENARLLVTVDKNRMGGPVGEFEVVADFDRARVS